MKEVVAKKYTKKPVAIEAMKVTTDTIQDVLTWCNHENIIACSSEKGDEIVGISINTLEGTMLANIGDMVIKGVKGEFYPCKPDVFEATYDEYEEGPCDFAYIITQDTILLAASSLEADKTVHSINADMNEHHITFTCPQGFFVAGFGSTLARTNGVYSVSKEEGETDGQH